MLANTEIANLDFFNFANLQRVHLRKQFRNRIAIEVRVARLYAQEEAIVGSALETRRCAVMHVRDYTSEARAHFRNCLSVSSKWPNGTVTAAETHSWLCAGEALERGLIGIRQLIAIKES